MPASVQAVLAARIDRLAEREKAVLQAAAVIGKEFPSRVLARVVGLDADELDDALREPRRRRVRLRAGALPRGRVRLQAPAHPGGRLPLAARASAAPPSTRRWRGRSPSTTRSASTSARRCSPSTGRRPARRSRRRAGTRAPRPGPGTSDPTQALRHWRNVRELADALPESAETMALGLDGEDLLAATTAGGSASRTRRRRRCSPRPSGWPRRSGDLRARAILLAGYGGVRELSEGDVREGARLARQAIALAEESGDPALYVAVSLFAYRFFCIGEYREAVAISIARSSWRTATRP